MIVMSRKILLIAIGLGLAVAIAGVVAFAIIKNASSLPSNSRGPLSQLRSKTPLQFTAKMFDSHQISHIGPLGELNGGYEETQALAGVLLNIKKEFVAGGKEIPIYAPADMTLERYAYFNIPGEGGLANWSLTFRFNQDITMRIDHITDVPQKIKDATTTTPKNTSAEDFLQRPITITTGEIIAYTSGTSQAKNWNIYVYDRNTKNVFINQARYQSDEIGQRLINAACPFAYYTPEITKEYIALMGYEKAGQRADCGQVSHDVAGTLSGMWHFSAETESGTKLGKEGVFTSPLSMYKTSANSVIIAEINGKRFEISPTNPTYIDPAAITTQHCYSLVDGYSNAPAGYAFFKIVSKSEMAIAYSPSGTCPAQLPAGAKSYFR